jgi:hypothetical protein
MRFLLPVAMAALTLMSATARAAPPRPPTAPAAPTSGLAPGQAYLICMENIQVGLVGLTDPDLRNSSLDHAAAACAAKRSSALTRALPDLT